MQLQTTISDLTALINSFAYPNNGDHFEKIYGPSITNTFPNSELFWKKFVAPCTNRIVSNIIDPNESIRFRKGVSLDLQELSIIHYSVFLNLSYAWECLSTQHFSYFENFYTHLGSVCDLAEEFITKLYFITLECEGKETQLLQSMNEEQFLEIARAWYNKYYTSTYQHYLSKGKTAPVKLISRSNILDEYFEKSQEIKEYANLAIQLRTYRNVIVHNTQIATQNVNSLVYVPKKQVIHSYKSWHQVFSVTSEKFKTDFIGKDIQMHQDLTELKTKLNALWVKPIGHFEKLLFTEKNDKLLDKYSLDFIG